MQRFQEVCNPTNWNNIPVIRSTWTIVPRALRRCSKQGKVLGRSATHTLLYKNHTRFQLSHSFWCIPRYDQSGVCTPLRAELVIAWAQSRILNAGKLTFSDGLHILLCYLPLNLTNWFSFYPHGYFGIM